VVGDTVTLKVQTGNSCSAFSRVVGRVVYVGTHSIILEGNDAPLAGQMDADYVKLGQVYDNVMYPILTQYFGDPMAFDDSLLHVGKVTMLFTKRVNDQATDLLGFVTPCDQFPVAYDSLVPSSNHTPMFYARVPTTQAGSSGDVNVRSVWNALIPGTLIHESKHITAVAERFADPVGDLLEESWFEEGTAQVAMELYGRTVYGPAAGWKSNATYGNTVFCDVRGGLVGSSCYGKPYVMADPFLFLNDYMLSNETKSFLSAGSEDADIYGSAWLFARWLLDQYSTQESDLLKPLVRDATMAGVDNVTDKSGHTWNELAGYFTLALAADDYPGFTPAAGARYTVPSWNLRSIYSGFATDFPTNFSPWPLGVHAISFGASTTPVGSLVGGAGAFFDLSGTQATRQLIDIHAPGGGAIPATSPLRLLILRIQ
jgi:hypothetical protein